MNEPDQGHRTRARRTHGPNPLWMFFYARRRRGFPWLLLAVLVVVIALGLTFAIPGAPDAWRALAPAFIVVLILAGLVAAIAAVLRPRRKR